MLRQITFNDPTVFDYTDENNFIDEITDNCIILCEDNLIKDILYKQIEDICFGKHENESGHSYCTDNDEIPKRTNGFCYLPTAEIEIDRTQKIVLTIEAPYILTAKAAEDIWFAQRTADNKISLCPLKIFKGHKNIWGEGVRAVYWAYCNGRFGNYKYGNVVIDDEGLI